MLVLERGDLVFVFNFHPVNSFSEYRVGAYLPGPYKARPRPALGLCARVQKPKLTLASARPRAHARKGGGRGPALSRPAPRPDRRAARPEPVAGQATQPECAFALYMARGVQARAPSRSGRAPALQVVLSSDEAVFGGWRNASKEHDVEYATASDDHDGRPHSFTVYAPSRTVAVYAPAQYCDAKARARYKLCPYPNYNPIVPAQYMGAFASRRPCDGCQRVCTSVREQRMRSGAGAPVRVCAGRAGLRTADALCRGALTLNPSCRGARCRRTRASTASRAWA